MDANMESRVRQLENDFKLAQRDAIHAQQLNTTAIQGVQSQLADIGRQLREMNKIANTTNINEDEIESLSNEVGELRKELGSFGKKLTYYSGGIAAAVVLGGLLWGVVSFFINDKVETMKEDKAAFDRRIEKVENQQDELQRTLHRIELYLARGGEADRGTYTGEPKK